MKISHATAGLCFHPWVDIDLPDRVRNVPALITRHEKRFLYHAAKELYRGWGRIVDGGCFIGGSTVALAVGLAENAGVEKKEGRIAAYDQFHMNDAMKASEHIAKVFDGAKTDEEFYQQFLRNTAGLEQYIELHKGDLLKQEWAGDPIELYSLDVAKTWDLMRWVAGNHFVCFKPGTVLYHQDFFDPRTFYLPFVMSWLSDYFEYVAAVEATGAVFICTKPPKIEHCKANLRRTLTPHLALDLHLQWTRNIDPVRRGCVYIQAAQLARWFGDRALAKSMADEAQKYANLPRVRSSIVWLGTDTAKSAAGVVGPTA